MNITSHYPYSNFICVCSTHIFCRSARFPLHAMELCSIASVVVTICTGEWLPSWAVTPCVVRCECSVADPSLTGGVPLWLGVGWPPRGCVEPSQFGRSRAEAAELSPRESGEAISPVEVRRACSPAGRGSLSELGRSCFFGLGIRYLGKFWVANGNATGYFYPCHHG